MSMQCPACGSSHIQPLSVVHADGTQRFHAEHTGYTAYGQQFFGQSNGTQSSVLAQRCAPPPPPPPLFLGAFAFGALSFWLAPPAWCKEGCSVWRAAANLDWKAVGIGLAAFGVGWLLWKVYRVQAAEYNAAKHDWVNGWLCFGCGQRHVRG